MSLSHCNKHESWFCIVTFNKVLCQILMCTKVQCKLGHQTMVILHCNIHCIVIIINVTLQQQSNVLAPAIFASYGRAFGASEFNPDPLGPIA